MRRDVRGAGLSDVSGIAVSDRKAGVAAAPRDRKPAPAAYRAIARLAACSILLISVSAAGAYAVAARSQPVYAARSEVAFDLRSFGWDASERFLRTQPLIARSRNVLNPIAAQFDMPVANLEERFSVEPVGASGVIRLQFANPGKTLALDVLRALTARYLAETSAFDQTGPTVRWIITEPFLLAEPISPQPLRAAALGALGGAVLAAGIIMLWTLPWPAR